MPLTDYDRSRFESDGLAYDVYRRGSGPGVIVMAEIPGITPRVVDFADAVVAAGMTVAMPSLFGVDGRETSLGRSLAMFARTCVRREFGAFATNADRPITAWLNALARSLHRDVGGPGVGAVGMCFTGGFALAMMVEPAVIAPVLSQPSLPVGGRKAATDIGISAASLDLVRARIEAEGCAVRALRFTGDPLVPAERFEALRDALGDAVHAVEIPSPDPAWDIGKRAHSVLTEEVDPDRPGHPATVALRETVDFLADRLGVARAG